MEKLFGAMDQACIAMKDAKPDKKIAAINTFLKRIKAAGPKANIFVTKMFVDLNNSAADADMIKQELAEKKKDIQALSKILQNEVLSQSFRGGFYSIPVVGYLFCKELQAGNPS